MKAVPDCSDKIERCFTVWVVYRDVKFDIQIGYDCPQMGQIWDFLTSVSVYFGSARSKCTETDLKKYQTFPIWSQPDPIGCKI